MWPHRVLVTTPAFDDDLRLAQRVEDLALRRAMLSSPRRPDATIWISSAENCRRVARRLSFATCSAGSLPAWISVQFSLLRLATMAQKSPPSSTHPICPKRG